MNLLERLVLRKDLDAYLDNHWDAAGPLVTKLMPFLAPSLQVWAQNHSTEPSGMVCAAILDAYARHK